MDVNTEDMSYTVRGSTAHGICDKMLKRTVLGLFSWNCTPKDALIFFFLIYFLFTHTWRVTRVNISKSSVHIKN